jgi:hypothetical protein
VTGHHAPRSTELSANVDAEIRRLGLTNLQVARTVDVPERIVRRWRKADDSNPSWPNLVKFAELCGRDPAWFYVDHEQEPA